MKTKMKNPNRDSQGSFNYRSRSWLPFVCVVQGICARALWIPNGEIFRQTLGIVAIELPSRCFVHSP